MLTRLARDSFDLLLFASNSHPYLIWQENLHYHPSQNVICHYAVKFLFIQTPLS